MSRKLAASCLALFAIAFHAIAIAANATMSAVDPDPARQAVYAAYSGQRGVTAYSGAAYAPTLGARGSILVTGGGDGDYWGNEVYRYDIATSNWTRLSDPSLALNGQPNSDPSFDSTYAEYGDGTPGASHTYDHLQVVGGELFLAVSGAAYGLHRSGFAHAFDPATGQWSRATSNASRMLDHVHTTIYYPRLNRIYRTVAGGYHNDISYLDIAAGTWTDLTMAYSNVGYDPVSAYGPEIDAWVISSVVGPYDQPRAFQLGLIDMTNTAAGLYTPGIVGDVPPPGTGAGYGLRWYNGAAYLYRGAFEPQAMYRIVPPASGSAFTQPWTSTRIPLVGSPVPAGSAAGVFSRFLLIDAGRFAYVPSTTDPVVIWDASGTILVDGAVSIDSITQPAVYGQPVNVAVSVSGTPTATGTVTIGSGASMCMVTLVNATGNCDLTGLPVGAGQTMTATYSGDSTYPPSSKTGTFDVGPAPQSISFAPLADKTLGSAPFAVSASGGASGNPVVFTSQTAAVCTCGGSNGSVVTLVAKGTCTIAANQAGNANYTAAPEVTQGFQVTAGTPGPPTNVNAVAGNAQATVSFSPPTDTGGSPITGYLVVSNPAGGADATPNSTSTTHTVNGLVNGTAYTFIVTASNGQGSGTPSAPSNSVTPIGSPGAPTNVVATAGNAQASVTFSAPLNTGGSPITGYTVASNPAGGVDSNAGSAATSHTITGLVNGTAYTFTVTATNAAGTSAPSTPSNSVTPIGPPGAPTNVVATASNAQASVTFSAPLNTGGSPITGYTVASNPAGGVDSNAGSTSTSHTITGLVNGTTYTFTVTATNAAGTSAPSAPSNSVTPQAAPVTSFSAPTPTGTGTATVTLSGGGATCGFTSIAFLPVSQATAPPPSNQSFPHGLLDFTAGGCIHSSTVTLTITYPQAIAKNANYWKYGPTPPNNPAAWYALTGSSKVSINGATVSFIIVDGKTGDDDLVANGTIVDQGGIAVRIR